MPRIYHKLKHLVIDDKKLYSTNVIELTNGVVGYNAENRELADEFYSQKQKEIIEKIPEIADILSVPKLNACHFILIKSRKNPNLFAVGHIYPHDNKAESYKELLYIFIDNRDLDVVFCGRDPRNLSLFIETTI